ncbi:MAG: cation diffusion facilitator family transporter [Actinomycetota bacterium]|nr:cation diffusion facilitator family transporter [Actinomycetota bacterium]
MTRSKRLLVALLLNLVLVVGLVAVGASAHSLGVLAAGADYLADAAAIGFALLAIWLSDRPPTARRPGGHPRANAIAALVNGSWLLVLSVLIVASAADRLISGTPAVHGLPVLIVSGIAAAAMIVAAVILGGDLEGDDDDEDDDEALSLRAVLLDTAADAAAAAGVAITGAVIFATGRFDWLDPTVALVIALVIGFQALLLVRRVFRALRRPLAGSS